LGKYILVGEVMDFDRVYYEAKKNIEAKKT
jgi:hypothetical protein